MNDRQLFLKHLQSLGSIPKKLNEFYGGGYGYGSAVEDPQAERVKKRREELKAIEKRQVAGAATQGQELVAGEAPENVTSTTKSEVVAPDPEGSFTTKDDGGAHNRAAYSKAVDRFQTMKRSGEITATQAADYASQLQKRQENIIDDQYKKQRDKAVEQGLDTVADVAGLAPGLGDVVDVLHAGSYAARAALSDDPDERADYLQKTKDQAIYGVLLPAGIGAAAKGISKVAGKGSELAARTAEMVGAKRIAGVVNKTAELTGKAAKAMTDVNAVGAVGGGYAGMQLAPQDADLGTKLMYGFGGAVLGGQLVKAGNKIPGLGKELGEIPGSFSGLARGAGQVTGRAIEAAKEASPVSAQQIKNAARVATVAGSLAFGQGPAMAGPAGSAFINAKQGINMVDSSAPVSAKPSATPEAPTGKAKVDSDASTPIKAETGVKAEAQAKQKANVNDAVKAEAEAKAKAKAEAEAKQKAQAEENAKRKQDEEGKKKLEAPKARGGFPLDDLTGPRLVSLPGAAFDAKLQGYESTKFAKADRPVFINPTQGESSPMTTRRPITSNITKPRGALDESQMPEKPKPKPVFYPGTNHPINVQVKDTLAGDPTPEEMAARIRDALIRGRSRETREKVKYPKDGPINQPININDASIKSSMDHSKKFNKP